MTMPINRYFAVALLATPLLLGCGESSAPKTTGGSMDDLLDSQVEEEIATAQVNSAEDAAAKAAELRAEADRLANEEPSEITIDDMQRGAALKGGGAMSTTLRGGIAAEQKLGLAQVTHALGLFYGLEGHWPEDHDEFMEKVVEYNELKLEPLKEPYEYYYDAELEQQKPLKRPSQEAIDAAKAAADAAEAALAE